MKPHYCKANSISNIEAGTRMRLSLERLVAGGAGLRAFRVAAATWGLTVGYAKAWDTVYLSSLADLTGMDDRAVRRGLKDCVDLGALQWRPSKWMGKPSLVGLPDSGSNQPGLTEYSGSDSGSQRPSNLEPGTQDSLRESAESDEWRASSEGAATIHQEQDHVNADELARWREANAEPAEPDAEPDPDGCPTHPWSEFYDDGTCIACVLMHESEPFRRGEVPGTQRWLTDPSVPACRKDGCFWDAATCPDHQTRIHVPPELDKRFRATDPEGTTKEKQ